MKCVYSCDIKPLFHRSRRTEALLFRRQTCVGTSGSLEQIKSHWTFEIFLLLSSFSFFVLGEHKRGGPHRTERRFRDPGWSAQRGAPRRDAGGPRFAGQHGGRRKLCCSAAAEKHPGEERGLNRWGKVFLFPLILLKTTQQQRLDQQNSAPLLPPVFVLFFLGVLPCRLITELLSPVWPAENKQSSQLQLPPPPQLFLTLFPFGANPIFFSSAAPSSQPKELLRRGAAANSPELTGSLSLPSAVLIGGLLAVVFADFLVIGKEQEATDCLLV